MIRRAGSATTGRAASGPAARGFARTVLHRAVTIVAALGLPIGAFGSFATAATAAVTPVLTEPTVADATWQGGVGALIVEHCGECHRPGGGAPMALLSWDQSRPWARAIAREVDSGAMPPWHADPRYGVFANDRRLSEAQRRLLLAWAARGAPLGEDDGLPASGFVPDEDPADTGVAPAGSQWRIGEPDLVFELPEEVVVPARGEVPYHDYVIDPGFTEDVWVRAAEAQPGNPAVVHHIIVDYQISNPLRRRQLARQGLEARVQGSLGGYVPGDEPMVLPQGLARRIPAGARLHFQMHYTPSGSEQRDRSRVGLVLAEGPPRHEVRTGIASSPFISIPPGSAETSLSAEHVFRRDSVLLSMRPHMHLRGKRFEYRAHFPDGSEEILLLVPDYDFDWQTRYVLAEPKRLPAGTRLVCTGTWDNSDANPDNPDPTRRVSWGQQTSDEMMIGFFEYYEEGGEGRGAEGAGGQKGSGVRGQGLGIRD
ncbi:MAG: cytochrome c [Acidobacteria bacterium]|nr:MAG: cytochrome c [Acidobacteriota bacterium]